MAALRNFANTPEAENVRHIDVCRFVEAAASGLEIEPGAFTRAYAANRKTAVEVTVENDMLATAIRTLLAHLGSWTGTAAELLFVLEHGDALTNTEPIIDDRTKASRTWPKNATSIGIRLRRVAPALRDLGFEVEYTQATDSSRKRLITLKLPPETCTPEGNGPSA